ncbi:MAG: hydrogenase/urease accessory protein HupE [Patiriisocius sp.]|jgi:hydrogenase/urease accessory protein HupE
MDTFILFFKQGLAHILDIDGIDHILFILSITVFFNLKEWKKLAWLITAFTIGHSITLVLSVFEILTVNRNLIELLIPITIIITCLNNILKVYRPSQINYMFLYGMVLFFGSIHGLAFSNFLKMALFEGDSLAGSLLGFNLGIEAGQLLIVLLFLGSIQLILRFFKAVQHTHIIIVCSVLVLLSALKILWDLV